MAYKIRLDALVRRQMIRWKLADRLLIDVHLRLNDELPRSPTSFLRQDPTWFDSEGMVYGFDLIDPENRMLVHPFQFQVFYHADEQTLLGTRGAHVAAEGLYARSVRSEPNRSDRPLARARAASPHHPGHRGSHALWRTPTEA